LPLSSFAERNNNTNLEEGWKPDPSTISKEVRDVLRIAVFPINILWHSYFSTPNNFSQWTGLHWTMCTHTYQSKILPGHQPYPPDKVFIAANFFLSLPAKWDKLSYCPSQSQKDDKNAL